jgi:hypothetical protein
MSIMVQRRPQQEPWRTNNKSIKPLKEGRKKKKRKKREEREERGIQEKR